MSREQEVVRSIDEAIAKVRAANTVDAAHHAASRGNGWDGWIADSADHRASLVAELDKVWDGGRILSSATPEEIAKYKQLLVKWLQDLREAWAV